MDFAAQSKTGAGIARLLRPSFLYLWLATTLADFETNNIAGGRCKNSVIVRLNHRLLLQLSCRGLRFAVACSAFALKCQYVFDGG
jgi:hypothetical protein